MKILSTTQVRRLALTLVCLLAAGSAAADSHCLRVKSGSGGITSTDAFGTPLKGGANLEMAAGSLAADVVTMLLGLPKPRGADMSAKTLHCFMAWQLGEAGPTAVGHFCTQDKATLSPGETPAVLLINTRSRIVSGDWLGRNVTGGRLRLAGRIDMGVPADPDSQPPATAQWAVKGKVCVEE